MRPYTIALSIVVHVIAACAAVISPLLVTDELPAPRTATEFIQVTTITPPPPPPPPAPTTGPRVESLRTDTAPLVAPDGISTEPGIEPPVDAPPIEGGVISFGDCNNCASVVDAAPPPPARASEPIRVGGNIRPPQKVSDAAPEYPPIARAAGVEGIVILEAVIAEDGAVQNVRVLRSIPLLDAAAMAAVRQWRFTPTLLNGQPVPIVMTVTVAFKLR